MTEVLMFFINSRALENSRGNQEQTATCINRKCKKTLLSSSSPSSSLNFFIILQENRIVELKQKLSLSQNDVTKLQELRDEQVKELGFKQEQIVRLETEIKEGELMKNTIMSLMQTKSFKK